MKTWRLQDICCLWRTPSALEVGTRRYPGDLMLTITLVLRLILLPFGLVHIWLRAYFRSISTFMAAYTFTSLSVLSTCALDRVYR
jgi:hypothetical protein